MPIDIIEQHVYEISPELLDILLQDKTTGKHIKWATDNYQKYGDGYSRSDEIVPDLISGWNALLIQTRVSKSMVEQTKRTRDRAEVFTPSWVCNIQNNSIDEAWFGYENVFNKPNQSTWEVQSEPVHFPEGKTWKMYVDARRMEISCGEAPYLVSRYDTVTGSPIPIQSRIGLLDRKLRVISENTSKEDWYKWALRAFQSIYAYEFQGDSLLLARENLLYTFLEYYQYYFNEKASLSQAKKVANIIAWNIWQMDAFTLLPPYSSEEASYTQCSLFSLEEEDKDTSKPCRIYDWRSNESLEYRSLVNGGNT